MGIAKNLSKNVRKYSKRFYWNFNYKKMLNFISKLVNINLNQGWPTQIGLWAATWKVCLKY